MNRPSWKVVLARPLVGLLAFVCFEFPADAATHRKSTSHTAAGSASQRAFDSGKALAQSGDCAAAEPKLSDALASDPDNPVGNYYLAECLIQDGKYVDAALPLRLAVQYGTAVPEGQMAEGEAKRLAAQYSPNAGIAMGCAVPVAPPPLDGASATRAQLLDAHEHLQAFTNASDRFQSCLDSAFKDLQDQAGQSGGSYTGSALERKFQSQIDKNDQAQQDAKAQYAAALTAYNARAGR